MRKIFYRIDDRLVVSDRVKKDKDYKRMLEFSVPFDINVDIFDVKEMSFKVRDGYLNDEDTIVLFESSYDVLDLLDYGVRIDKVIVGCLHYNGNNRLIRKSVAVSEDDIRNFEDIFAMGTRIECQSLPKDKGIDLIDLIRRIK
jgi:PTS system mannose-specific IIB component